MSVLDNDIAKYTKRGFKVAQKRTLKHGVRVFLKKESTGLFGLGWEGIYIYYVDGDATVGHMREFLKDYSKVYDEREFDEDDRGYFVCSGSMDEKLFKDLRKSLVEDEVIRGSIRTVVSKERAALEEERIKEKVTEGKITRERISMEEVVGAINSVQFIRQPKERGYETQLYQALVSRGYPTVHERERRGARFDLVLGKDEIAVELKIVKSASVFGPLLGQIYRYKDRFRKIIIVLIDDLRNPSIMKEETERIKSIDPENIKIIVK